MRARQEEPDPHISLPAVDDGAERRTTIGGDIAHDWTARFVIDNTMDGLSLLTGVSLNGEPPGDYFLHPESESFAVLSGNADEGFTVRQGGPVQIWDSIESAIGDWREQGSPQVTDFRVRVTLEAQEIYPESTPNVSWTKVSRS